MNSIFTLRSLPKIMHRISNACAGIECTSKLILPCTHSVVIERGRRRGKHWNPKFRKERAAKVIKIELPDFEEERNKDKLTIEEARAKIKEKGIAPARIWNERPMLVSCTGSIMDPYVPPEGDGKVSIVSTPGVKQTYESFGKKGKSYLELRKIRSIDYDFDVPTVAEKARSIYVDAQNALAANDEDKLHDLVTEKAFPEMMENVKNKTVIWKFIQDLEAPRIVHIRTMEMMSKGNLFAQITVRMHTQQTLAIYDRFGRLMHGSEDAVRDVLEYVVLEKHISAMYATWRIHGKIIPDWLPPKDSVRKTFIKPDVEKEHPEPPVTSVEKTEETSSDSNLTPALA